jgi:hypothetical protein
LIDQFLQLTSLDQLVALFKDREGAYDEGNWRYMQLCIPAATEVYIFIGWLTLGTFSTHQLRDKDGVKMKALVELSKSRLEQVVEAIRSIYASDPYQ